MHRDSCLVVIWGQKTQDLVEKRWIELVQGFRTSLERMKEQPKYPPLPEDEME